MRLRYEAGKGGQFKKGGGRETAEQKAGRESREKQLAKSTAAGDTNADGSLTAQGAAKQDAQDAAWRATLTGKDKERSDAAMAGAKDLDPASEADQRKAAELTGDTYNEDVDHVASAKAGRVRTEKPDAAAKPDAKPAAKVTKGAAKQRLGASLQALKNSGGASVGASLEGLKGKALTRAKMKNAADVANVVAALRKAGVEHVVVKKDDGTSDVRLKDPKQTTFNPDFTATEALIGSQYGRGVKVVEGKTVMDAETKAQVVEQRKAKLRKAAKALSVKLPGDADAKQFAEGDAAPLDPLRLGVGQTRRVGDAVVTRLDVARWRVVALGVAVEFGEAWQVDDYLAAIAGEAEAFREKMRYDEIDAARDELERIGFELARRSGGDADYDAAYRGVDQAWRALGARNIEGARDGLRSAMAVLRSVGASSRVLQTITRVYDLLSRFRDRQPAARFGADISAMLPDEKPRRQRRKKTPTADEVIAKVEPLVKADPVAAPWWGAAKDAIRRGFNTLMVGAPSIGAIGGLLQIVGVPPAAALVIGGLWLRGIAVAAQLDDDFLFREGARRATFAELADAVEKIEAKHGGESWWARAEPVLWDFVQRVSTGAIGGLAVAGLTAGLLAAGAPGAAVSSIMAAMAAGGAGAVVTGAMTSSMTPKSGGILPTLRGFRDERFRDAAPVASRLASLARIPVHLADAALYALAGISDATGDAIAKIIEGKKSATAAQQIVDALRAAYDNALRVYGREPTRAEFVANVGGSNVTGIVSAALRAIGLGYDEHAAWDELAADAGYLAFDWIAQARDAHARGSKQAARDALAEAAKRAGNAAPKVLAFREQLFADALVRQPSGKMRGTVTGLTTDGPWLAMSFDGERFILNRDDPAPWVDELGGYDLDPARATWGHVRPGMQVEFDVEPVPGHAAWFAAKGVRVVQFNEARGEQFFDPLAFPPSLSEAIGILRRAASSPNATKTQANALRAAARRLEQGALLTDKNRAKVMAMGLDARHVPNDPALMDLAALTDYAHQIEGFRELDVVERFARRWDKDRGEWVDMFPARGAPTSEDWKQLGDDYAKMWGEIAPQVAAVGSRWAAAGAGALAQVGRGLLNLASAGISGVANLGLAPLRHLRDVMRIAARQGGDDLATARRLLEDGKIAQAIGVLTLPDRTQGWAEVGQRRRYKTDWTIAPALPFFLLWNIQEAAARRVWDFLTTDAREYVTTLAGELQRGASEGMVAAKALANGEVAKALGMLVPATDSATYRRNARAGYAEAWPIRFADADVEAGAKEALRQQGLTPAEVTTVWGFVGGQIKMLLRQASGTALSTAALAAIGVPWPLAIPAAVALTAYANVVYHARSEWDRDGNPWTTYREQVARYVEPNLAAAEQAAAGSSWWPQIKTILLGTAGAGVAAAAAAATAMIAVGIPAALALAVAAVAFGELAATLAPMLGYREDGARIPFDDDGEQPATKEGRAKVSAKISKLMGEGYPQMQAIAIALNMWRRGKLAEDATTRVAFRLKPAMKARLARA